MATFSYAPSYSSKVSYKPRFKEAVFGDGYEQAAEDGINTNPATWNLSFSNITNAQAESIIGFFETNKTWITSFDWTSPRGVAGKYKCKTFDEGFDTFGTRQVTATFQEVFQ